MRAAACIEIVVAKIAKQRCDWGQRGGELMTAYHDKEWGVPVHDDRKQF